MINEIATTNPYSFLQYPEFELFANSISNGIVAINNLGRVIFANQEAKRILFQEDTPVLPPYSRYTEIIRPTESDFLDLFAEVLRYERDSQRQIASQGRTYLAECRVTRQQHVFHGLVATLSDITEIAQKERQHELLYQVSSALARVSSIDQILKTTISQVVKSLSAKSANVMLLEPQSQVLKIKADTNREMTGHAPREFKLGEGIAGKAALEGKPRSVYDVLQAPDYLRRADHDKGALLVVPIISKNRLFGVLNILNATPRYFTENELQFTTMICNEIAIALESHDLYQRLQRKIHQLSKLYLVSTLSDGKNLDTRLQKIIKLVPDLLEAEDTAMYLRAPGTDRLVLKYQKNVAQSTPLEIDLKKPGLSQTVFSQQETVVINNIDESPDPILFKKYKIHNVISAPISVNQEPIGVIHVFNKWHEPFTEEDKNLLNIIAYRISIKIENVQLIRKVQSEKELLDKIIKNTSEGVAVLNRKRKIIIWNRYLEELTGLRAREVIGQPCYKVLYNQLALKQLTQQIYATQNDTQSRDMLPATCEQQLKTVRGDKIWVSAVYSYILDTHKHIENTIVVFRNISKDKELIDAKNDFISVTTHELRTPLTAVKGYLSMILKGDAGEVPPQQHEYFTKAYLATERLVLLVEELLHVFRIDENRLRLSPAALPIAPLIEESIEDLSQKARAKSITITYSAGLPILVEADPEKTKQILTNLLDNAIKYTKERGTIRIALEKRTHEVLIAVQDTGVGIPSRHLESIFDRFVRIPNSQSVKAGGAGLGLYIVKNLVEKQGGKIWVTSQIGKGSTFQFTLPLAHTSTARKTTKEPAQKRKGVQ